MIEFVGLSVEKKSSFFIENKRVCEFWDQLITKKRGMVNAKYTAWALALIGEFKANYEWEIELKKKHININWEFVHFQ